MVLLILIVAGVYFRLSGTKEEVVPGAKEHGEKEVKEEQNSINEKVKI